MTHKLVLRLLDADGALLTWTAVEAIARGDGALWSPTPELACDPCERSGTPATLSIHWADVNVETRVPITMPAVREGDPYVALQFHDQPIVRLGQPASGLAPVTMRRAAAVRVPVGLMGAR